MEDVAAEAGVGIDEVAGARHPEVPDDLGCVVAAQRLDLVELPAVELALDALGVRVLGGEEAAQRMA